MSDTKQMVDEFYDEGAWLAGTMGDLLAFLVDSATKDDAIYRIIGDEYPETERDEFIRRIELYVVPRKHSKRLAGELGCKIVSHRLLAFWQRQTPRAHPDGAAAGKD